MTLQQMEYFMMTARECNFTKAAGKLSITQQSLSASIASLETELGCPLFIRHTPLELTYAGTEFLQYAGEILQKVKNLKQNFHDISTDQKGMLRIGIAPTRGRAIMPDIIHAFWLQHPGIQIVLKENTNSGLQQDLLKGDIDLAIAAFDTDKNGITLQHFYEEEVALFAAKDLLCRCFGDDLETEMRKLKQGTFSPLQKCPFVLGNPDDIAGKIGMQLLHALPSQPEIPVRADNVETLLALCEKGIGCCFCPTILAKAILPPKQFQSLYQFSLGDAGKYPIYFGYKTVPHTWRILDTFIHCSNLTR